MINIIPHRCAFNYSMFIVNFLHSKQSTFHILLRHPHITSPEIVLSPVPTVHTASTLRLSQIQRPIGWPQIVQRYENHIDQRPHAEATEAEQFADALLPVAQIESVRPEATQRHADDQRRRPLVALRPVAALLFLELPLAQTEQVRLDRAVGTNL